MLYTEQREKRSKILETIIDLIKDHLKPDDIFDIDELRLFVSANSKVTDVFSDEELDQWVYHNGFIDEREQE